MKHTTPLMLAAAGLAASQHSTVSVMLPMGSWEDMAGSVISAGPTATSYFIACPSDAPDANCGPGDGMHVLYGPSTLSFAMTVQDAASTISGQCTLNPAKDIASCIDTMVGHRFSTAAAEAITGYKSMIIPLTITAGADKLAGADVTSTSTTAPAATPSTVSTSARATTTDAQGSSGGGGGSGSGSGSATSVTSVTSSHSTGGVPRVTHNAVVLGAVALLGGAMVV